MGSDKEAEKNICKYSFLKIYKKIHNNLKLLFLYCFLLLATKLPDNEEAKNNGSDSEKSK